MAGAADFKQDLRTYLDWSIGTVLSDGNIDVRLGTKATRELVEQERPDAYPDRRRRGAHHPGVHVLGTDKIIWAGDAETGEARSETM